MSLKIYNTPTKQKEDFVPLTPGQVKMYCCGPTVYGLLHVGNFRGAIFYNLVRNWLERSGYEVTYVYNFTDVDDKIIDVANKEGVSADVISERYIAEFKKDYGALKLKPHTYNPKVTEHIAPIIAFIEQLQSKGVAYALKSEAGEDVYFDVTQFPEYGKLSHKNLEELQTGTRAEVNLNKKNPADFVLWKSAKPGEPSWDSPWGPGRPGWHIECSVMIKTILGDTIDIHGGGLDLIFPHHENEIAQSEACNHAPFVKYWVHNNMIQFGDQKMSKSLGNIITGRSFLDKYDGEIFKFVVLSSHYRSLLNFSEEQIQRGISSLAKFYSALSLCEEILEKDLALVPVPEKFQNVIDFANQGIEEALNDDFNTPEVWARLFEVLRVFNNHSRTPGAITPEKRAIAEVFSAWLKDKGLLMSLFNEPARYYLKTLDDRLLEEKGLKREQVDQMVQERSQARSEKNFAKSDEIRDQLMGLGIAVQDSQQGTTWEVAK